MMYSNIVAHTQSGLEYRPTSFTEEKNLRGHNNLHAILRPDVILENDYLQYQLGLMEDELWDSKQELYLSELLDVVAPTPMREKSWN